MPACTAEIVFGARIGRDGGGARFRCSPWRRCSSCSPCWAALPPGRRGGPFGDGRVGGALPARAGLHPGGPRLPARALPTTELARILAVLEAVSGGCSRRPRWPGWRAPARLRTWRRARGDVEPDGRGAPRGPPRGPLQRKAGGRPRSTTTRGPGLGDRNCCHSIGSPQVVRPRRPPAARFGRAVQTRQPLGPLKRPSSTAPSPRPEPGPGSGRRRCTGSPESAARASGQEGRAGRGTPGLKRRAAAGRGGLPHTSLSRGHLGPTGKPRLRRRMRTKCPAWPTWPQRPATWPPCPSACASGRPAVGVCRARGTGTGRAPQSAPRVP